MTQDQQLKLQAFFDGELSDAEAREVANWLARDPEAAALQSEFKNTRQALAGFERDVKLPEPREFYWSKIKREIERLEPRQQPQREPSALAGWLRVLIPAGAFAIVAITGMIAAKNLGLLNTGAPAVSTGPEMQTAFADSGFTYRDETEGMTLVWLSYGENGLANGKSAATIQ